MIYAKDARKYKWDNRKKNLNIRKNIEISGKSIETKRIN